MKSRSNNVSTNLYETLKSEIIDGTYMPGYHLVEADIMLKYNVSRITIREVLRLLEGEGLVEAIPNKGVRVRNLSGQDILEYWQIQEYLFALATRLAVERDYRSLAKKLRKIMDDDAEAIKIQDFRKHAALMTAFHQTISDNCGNEKLASMLSNIITLMQLPQALNVLALRMDESFKSHSLIVDAVSDGNAELAERRMREHMEATTAHSASQ